MTTSSRNHASPGELSSFFPSFLEIFNLMVGEIFEIFPCSNISSAKKGVFEPVYLHRWKEIFGFNRVYIQIFWAARPKHFLWKKKRAVMY